MILNSCSTQKQSEQNSFNYEKYKTLGSEISGLAQKTLVEHLTGAIEEGGTDHAIRFCNLNALGLIDSISSINQCVVSRITDRNRNPSNVIRDLTDKNIWEYYTNSDSEKLSADTAIELSDNIVYYKPIKIGMPTCLKCHGKPGIDIDQKTLATIDSLYLKDLARNYEAGNLRGLWKIEFQRSVQ